MAANIGNKNLKVWLNFQHSPVEDVKGNTWTSHGNPTIGTANAFNGNALQLDGQSYIKLSGIDLGGQDFYIDGWVYVDPASPNYARIITVVNPTNGYYMFSLRIAPNNSSKLNLWINKTKNVSADIGYDSSEGSTASVRQLVHFKLIYRPDVYNFVLCINDRTQAYVIGSSYCPQYTRQKFDIYIGAMPNGTEGLIGSIDELRIYDGTWFTYNYGNVPTTSDYNSVYFKADIKTDIHNALSEWRYENAGYADLLITSGTTVTGLTPTQSKTGTAFYQPEQAKCFAIPSTKEIWIKCDVYCNLTNRWRMYNGGANGVTGLTSQTSGEASLFANGTNVKQFTSSTIKQNQRQTVLLHMVSDSSAGIVEAWLDDTKLYTYTGNVNNGDAFADIYLQSDGAGTFFSNVIISNAPLNIDDDVDLHTYLNVDLARSTSNAVTAAFDTSRSLVTTQTVNADTSRNTAVSASLNADTLRNVGKALTTNFDTARGVANAVTANLDTARELASGFKAWLRFDESTTKDEYGNRWTAYNSPTISTDNASFGKALQLTNTGLGANGQFVALDDGCTIGGQDFTVDGWAFMPTDIPRVARIFSFCNVFGNNAQKTFYLGQKATTGQLELNYNNNWSALSANLKGQRFHWAVVYEHSKNLLTFYINGQVVGTLNQTFTRTFYQYVFVGRANYDTHSTWLGAIDEFRIDDGLARWTENFTPPTLNDYTNFPLALELKPDTFRNAFKSIAFRANLVRNVSNALTANIDTARNISGAVTVSADTARIISVPCNVAADTLRIVTIWRYENYGTADLLSVGGTTVDNLDKSQAIYKTAFYQTERAKCFDIPSTKDIWIKFDVYFDGTNRWRAYNGFAGITAWNSTNTAPNALGFFDSAGNQLNYVQNVCKPNQLQTFLLHMVSGSSSGIIEAWLDGTKLYTYTGNVNNGDAFADIYLQSDGAGTFFSNVIISPYEIGLDENTTLALNVSCDTLRFFPSNCLVSLDTARNVLWQAPLNIDTYRFVTCSVDIIADIFSTVNYAVQIDCDVIRTLPHSFILSPVENLGGVPDTSNDAQALTQSIEIRLNEQSLTDEVVIVTVKPVDIMEQVQGQYLDYPFNMRIETCKQRGILNTCTCCSDIDEILYKQLEYTIPDDELWRFTNPEEVQRNFPGIKVFRRDSAPLIEEDDDNSEDLALASTHIATIAGIIGKKPILQYADFISTVDITSGGTTYNDLIRSIFGWTARIPQHMINCFLRDDKLFVIQRGFEQNEITLSNLSGSEIVGVDKELMRTIWGSSVWSKTETREVFGFRYIDNLKWSEEPEVDDEESSQPSKPVRSTSRTSGGLIKETVEYHNGVKTTTTYDYDDDELVIQTVVCVESEEITTRTITTYEYITLDDGRKVLEKEKIREEELGDGYWEIIDEKTTKHEYTATGPGQVHHYTTDSDGNVDNVIGNGTGDDRRTPYAKWITAGGKRLLSYQSIPKYYQQQRTIYGLTPFDTSFPVHGDEKLIEITNAIKWLNRRTQETLTLNLFDYPHVIDFNDRIVINGNVYYLKGNTALKTPRIVNKQTLSLVRWY